MHTPHSLVFEKPISILSVVCFVVVHTFSRAFFFNCVILKNLTELLNIKRCCDGEAIGATLYTHVNCVNDTWVRGSLHAYPVK